MTARCYIHVGLPKTGTSYLQSIFWQSRTALAAQDLAMLPATKSDTFHLMLAVRGLLRPTMDPPDAFTALDRFREQAATLTCSRALVSQELLAAATPEQVADLLDALPGYEVHVVVTVRDLAHQIPSAWQQQVKARGTIPFDAYLAEITGGEPGPPQRRAYDLLGVLDRWGAHVQPERIHVITVPRKGRPPSALLERFCSVLAVDPTPLHTETERTNRSLGLVQAEVLRRVNVALGDRLPHARAGYRRQGKAFLAGEVLRKQEAEVPRLPSRLVGWCRESSRVVADRLATGGYDIVGDLDDLNPDDDSFAEGEPEVTEAQVAQSATEALASILATRAGETRELARLHEQVRVQRRAIRAQQRQISELSSGRSRLRGRLRRAATALRGG